MGNKKKQLSATPVAPQVTTDNQEQTSEKKIRYVVIRDGYRVSDKEYDSPEDIEARQELEFWKLVETNHSWGAPVKIVLFDNKLHRVW